MIYTKFHYDQLSDTTAVERIQDCTPILDNAAELRATGAVGSSEMRHAASFPAVIVETYCNQTGITFNEFLANPVHVKRMLSDPDLKGFRVWEGRV